MNQSIAVRVKEGKNDTTEGNNWGEFKKKIEEHQKLQEDKYIE